jgi:hypothetical protein
MQKLPRWYERDRWAYASDQQTTEAYATWFGAISWKLLGTFTFARRVSDQQAADLFSQFIDRLEHNYRSDIGCVRGDEKRFSGCGKPACGRHFHALLTSAAPITSEMVESVWTILAGHRNDGNAAMVVPFDPNKNGISYVLKFINQPDGDWAHRKLHLFHPEARKLQILNRRTGRHLTRHRAREREFANVEATLCVPPAALHRPRQGLYQQI